MLAELRRARHGHLLAFHVLLSCTAGRTPTEIATGLFCSRSSVYRIVQAYQAHLVPIRITTADSVVILSEAKNLALNVEERCFAALNMTCATVIRIGSYSTSCSTPSLLRCRGCRPRYAAGWSPY